MSDISKIKVSGVEYDIKDIQAREDLGNLGTRVTELEQHGGGSSVPKPLTYDYMPEGYPKKTLGTATLMEGQEVAFALAGDAVYIALLTDALYIAEGQTYTVNWDGTEHKCVCGALNSTLYIGNTAIMGEGADTGEPFIYGYNKNISSGQFATFDTSASHTISVKKIEEVITPMAEEFLPNTLEIDSIIMKSSTANSTKKFKITVDDSGALTATEIV